VQGSEKLSVALGVKCLLKWEGIKIFVIDFSVDHSKAVRFCISPPPQLQLAPFQG